MPEPFGNNTAFDSGLTDFTFNPSGKRMCNDDQAAVEFPANTASPFTCDLAGSYCIS